MFSKSITWHVETLVGGMIYIKDSVGSRRFVSINVWRSNKIRFAGELVLPSRFNFSEVVKRDARLRQMELCAYCGDSLKKQWEEKLNLALPQLPYWVTPMEDAQ